MKNHSHSHIDHGRTTLAMTRSTSAEETNEARKTKSVYLIGNSLTWDTVPSLLDGDDGGMWTVAESAVHLRESRDALRQERRHCGRRRCRRSSTTSCRFGRTTGDAVRRRRDDLEWIQLQPKAVIVIHTGWAHHEKQTPSTRARRLLERCSTVRRMSERCRAEKAVSGSRVPPDPSHRPARPHRGGHQGRQSPADRRRRPAPTRST